MLYRTYQPGDETAIAQLAYLTMDKSYEGMYSPQTTEGLKIYHNEENIVADYSKGAHIVVVEEKGKIVGTGTSSGTYVKRVFVHPDLHRQNIGNKIMDALERHICNQGLMFVELFATLPSELFYLKREYTTIDLYFNPEIPTLVEYYRMVKPLIKKDTWVSLVEKQWIIRSNTSSLVLNDGGEAFRFKQTGNIVYALFKTSASNFSEIIGVFTHYDTLVVSAHYVDFNKNGKSLYIELTFKQLNDGRYLLSGLGSGGEISMETIN